MKPKQEMAIYSPRQRRDVLVIFVNRFWQEHELAVFAMAKEEMSSSKICMIAISPIKSTIDNQISEMLSLSCIAKELTTETVDWLRESPPPNFLYYSVPFVRE